MAWMWPPGRGQIHTSVQAGGMANARMRSRVSGSSTLAPLAESKYANPRPQRRRWMPGAEQLLRCRRTSLLFPFRRRPNRPTEWRLSRPSLVQVLPVRSAEEATEPGRQRRPLLPGHIRLQYGRAARVGQRCRLFVAQRALHHGRGDADDLIAIDEAEPAVSIDRDAVEQVELRDLQHVMNRAEGLPLRTDHGRAHGKGLVGDRITFVHPADPIAGTAVARPRSSTGSLAPTAARRSRPVGRTKFDRQHAGVAQRQSPSLPSWLRGFDSRHPLQPWPTSTSPCTTTPDPTTPCSRLRSQAARRGMTPACCRAVGAGADRSPSEWVSGPSG